MIGQCSLSFIICLEVKKSECFGSQSVPSIERYNIHCPFFRVSVIGGSTVMHNYTPVS